MSQYFLYLGLSKCVYLFFIQTLLYKKTVVLYNKNNFESNYCSF